MTDLNLIDVLDEMMLLHVDMAQTLLKGFRGAAGVRVNLDGRPLYAMARQDVGPGNRAEYHNSKFQRASEGLAKEIEARIIELLRIAGTVGITARDFFLTYDHSKSDRGCLNVHGCISGGLGSLYIERSMIAGREAVLAASGVSIRVNGIVDNPSDGEAVAEAARGGLPAGLKQLSDRRLLLNQNYPQCELLPLWLNHTPGLPETCLFEHTDKLATLQTTSEYRNAVVYLQVGVDDRYASNDPRLILYDHHGGFSVDKSTTIAPAC